MTGRIRTIKPEWLEDEVLAAASDEARTLSVGLILLADDYGNGRASIATIAASIWRYQLERDDGAGAPEVLSKAARAFRELLDRRFIGCWSVDGQRYFAIRNWKKHQKVDKPGKPLVPAAPSGLFPKENGDQHGQRDLFARVSRESRESLAPDQRPTTNDQRKDLELGGASEAPHSELEPTNDPKPVASATEPKRPRRWTRVPDSWQPKPEHTGLAMQLGVPLDEELAKFRDHEFRNPKTDADACFRTWLRNSPGMRRQAISARLAGGSPRAGDQLERQLTRIEAMGKTKPALGGKAPT